MLLLRRVVQFCLGIQALAMLSSVLVIFSTISALRASDDPDALEAAYGLLTATAMILPLLALLPGIAWWTVRQHKPSARAWTIASSIVNLLITLLGFRAIMSGRTSSWHLYALSAATGILGLIVFGRKENIPQAKPKAPKPIRIAGDGTSKAKDYTSEIVSFGILWLSFHYWRQWANAQHLQSPGFVEGMVLFQFAVIVNTFGHEMGHFVAGWVSGMILRRFQVGPCMWSVRNGRWNFRFDLNHFYGGAVGMVLPTLKNIRGREAFLMMGGPVASLVFGAVMTTLALSAKGHFWEPSWAFLSMCAAMGWASFVVNLIPLQTAANYSDGAQLYQIVSGGPWAQFHIAFAMVASSLVTSIRARDFDVAIINRAAEFFTTGNRGLLLRLFACKYYLDAGRIPEGVASMAAAEPLYDQCTFEKPEDICAEFVYVNAFYKRDLAAADLWWRRIKALPKADIDADYWRARTALLWLRGERKNALEAWELGNELAQTLPATGVYEGTRACFSQLRWVLDNPVSTVPPPLESIKALAVACDFSESPEAVEA